LTLSDSLSDSSEDSIDPNILSDMLYDFIYSCLNKWKGDNGKGFSDFVSDRMIADILESEDFDQYKQILMHI
jgi:hypothetical protein